MKSRWPEFLALAALETDDCVISPFGPSTRYPRLTDPATGRQVEVHHAALALRVPPPFPGAVARHGPCRQPHCINHRHLSWGTRRENSHDMYRDGTLRFGERNPAAKLTRPDVEEMRQLRAQGWLQRQLAERFGVHIMTVNSIVRGRTWR